MAKPTDENLALPAFDLAAVRQQHGDMIEETINLRRLLSETGTGLILYFYPKDNTAGCTTQATDFSAKRAEFEQLGYSIIGVSRDSNDSHKKFIAKHDLTIALISDVDAKLCQYFDVIQEKNMYGKQVLGLVRSTFVFDKQGQLTHAQRNLRAKGYAVRLFNSLSS